MKRMIIGAVMIISSHSTQAQEVKRDPDPRKDYANVYWKRQYTLFDLLTDKPIFPKEINGVRTYVIYYSSNEDPTPHKGRFTVPRLERHLYYKFKTRKSCKKFCKMRRKQMESSK